MMLLACFLPLLAVAAAWPNPLNGYPTWQKRPTFTQRADIARLFRHLGDENMVGAIANELEALNINVTAPFHKIQPELAFLAVQKIVAHTVPTTVPEECSETVAVKTFLGFGRHYWHKVVEKAMLNAVQDYNQVVRIALLADPAMTSPSAMGSFSSGLAPPFALPTVGGIPENRLGGMGFTRSYESQRWQQIRRLAQMSSKLSRGQTSDVLSGIGIRTPGSAIKSIDDLVIPIYDFEEIKKAIIAELDRKLEKITPVADIMVIEKLFEPIKDLVAFEGAKGKSVGEVLSALSMFCQRELPTVFSGKTCQSIGAIPTRLAGIEDVISYMKEDYVTIIESVTRLPLAKTLFMEKMRLPTSKFVDALMVIENAYAPDNLPQFFVTLLGEAKQQAMILHSVSELVHEFVDDQTLYPFVSSLANQGQAKPLLKILLRTCAMQMVKLNVDPQEIRIIFAKTIQALATTGPMSSSSSLYNQLY